MKVHLKKNSLLVIAVLIFCNSKLKAQTEKFILLVTDTCNILEDFNERKKTFFQFTDSLNKNYKSTKVIFCFYNGFCCIDCFKEIEETYSKSDYSLFYVSVLSTEDYSQKRSWLKFFKSKSIFLTEENTVYINRNSCDGQIENLINNEKSPFILLLDKENLLLFDYEVLFDKKGKINKNVLNQP